MQLENSGKQVEGKTITKINICKNKIVLYFGKDKIDISPDVYVSDYFYVGKTLPISEIEKLEKHTYVSDAYTDALALLSRAMYTEWGLREKLYARDYHKSTVNQVITQLKKNKLINDKNYIKEYISYANDKLYGKNKIIQELKKRGIFDDMIRTIEFSDAKELSKAKKRLPDLEKQYMNLTTSDKRQHIFNALIREGFASDVASEISKKAKATSKSTSNTKLRKDFSIALRQGKMKYKTINGLKAYIFRSLAPKGHNISDINALWEEIENEITF